MIQELFYDYPMLKAQAGKLAGIASEIENYSFNPVFSTSKGALVKQTQCTVDRLREIADALALLTRKTSVLVNNAADQMMEAECSATVELVKDWLGGER